MSLFKSPPIRRYLGGRRGGGVQGGGGGGGVGDTFFFLFAGDGRPHPGSLRVITRRRRPSFLSSSQREMKDKRDRGM